MEFVEMNFPAGGIDRSRAFFDQRPRQIAEGLWARTTPTGSNVRAYEASTQRKRGGSRPGLAKYVSAAVVADWIIQELATVVSHGVVGAGMQQSQAGRIVRLVAVSQGNVYTANAGDTTWTTPTNETGDTPPLNLTGIVLSAPNGQKLFFADGTNWVYYDAQEQEVRRWAATEGTLPVDSANNTPRLICTWRGRTVLSGLLLDGHNWFMSAVNDPFDFDYAPLNITPTQAIAGNNAPQGLVGDLVTSLCPYSDDVLIFFGDHSIYVMAGDPMAGGSIDLVSDTIGGAWGVCWCKDPYGNVYFVSNKMGIYRMRPGEQPVRISQQIEQLVNSTNTGTSVIRLVWDDRFQGLHVFLTGASLPAAATHFFYEQRTGAWWTEVFANNNHNPVTCCLFDGNAADDRVALIGSWDGYVRFFDPDAVNDDGTTITSQVVVGPLNTKDLDEILLKALQAVLGTSSGSVTYSVHVGATAEAALSATAVASGTWTAGRNMSNLVRYSGHAIWVKISATVPWSMEQIRAEVASKGKVRRRGA